MKRLMLLAIISISISCNSKTPKEIKKEIYINKNNISGELLWQTIKNQYKQYSSFPNMKGMMIGNSPHGKYIKVYINNTVKNSLPTKILPQGSIIIKENYNDDKKLKMLTIMAKIKGYDPQHNDWFWVSIMPDGTIKTEGKINMCISCHNQQKENDYIMIYPINKKK